MPSPRARLGRAKLVLPPCDLTQSYDSTDERIVFQKGGVPHSVPFGGSDDNRRQPRCGDLPPSNTKLGAVICFIYV